MINSTKYILFESNLYRNYLISGQPLTVRVYSELSELKDNKLLHYCNIIEIYKISINFLQV